MAIFADPHSFKGFDDLINKKKEEVEKKALVKVNKLEAISDLNAWDGDSSEQRATNAEGVRLGGTPNVSLDAYETPKYNTQGEVKPYLGSVNPTDGSKRSKKWNLHRASYSKMSGVPVEQVTQEMLNNEGLRQAQVLQSTIAAGQGHYQPNTGKVLRNPLVDPVQQAQDPKQAAMDALLRPRQKELSPGNFEAFDPQVLANSQGTGYFGRALETFTNPVTGENINEALNTPEQNASFYSKHNSGAAMRQANAAVVLRHARDKDYDENDLSQTEVIPEEVKQNSKPGRVDLITNKEGFAVYYPEREGKAGFYKEDLTLAQAQKWKKAIEANPEAEHGVNDWKNIVNELVSGGVTVREGIYRSMDLAPMTHKEGIQQWNDYVTFTNEPTLPNNVGVTSSENVPIDFDNLITETDQARYLEVYAKQQLGTSLNEEDTVFTKSEKYEFLGGLDNLVKGKLSRDIKSLSVEQDAAEKVNRRKSDYEGQMAKEIYDDSGWDYLVYSLANRKASAAHSLVESAAFMGQLMIPYAGVATAVAASQENFKREYTDLHGNVPEGADLALLNSLSVVSVAVEKLGVKAITGKLPGLTKWVGEIGLKNPLLANIVKPIAAIMVPASIEGISGLTSTTAETIAKQGIQEDGSLVTPTGFEASEAFVNEAMAGGVMTATVNSSKLAKELIVGPNVKETADKIIKRNDVLSNSDLSDKQRINIESSRDKLVVALAKKREKLSIKSFKENENSEQQLVEIDAYLDELNGIALRSMGISSEQTDITTAAELSQRILEQLKKVNDTTDAEKNTTRRRIIGGLEKGLKKFKIQAGIDNSLAKVGTFQSNDKDVLNSVNLAKARAATRAEENHKVNVEYVKQDYAILTAKEPHKEGLFNTKRDAEIERLNEDLKLELAEIGEPIKAGVKATPKEETQAKSDSVESFAQSEVVDVKSTNYSPKEAVLTLLKGTTTSAIAKDPKNATELLRHSKNLNIQIQKLKDEGKSEDELKTLIAVQEVVAPLIKEVEVAIKEQQDKVKVVASDTDKILYSLDPKLVNTEVLNALDDTKLNAEQVELKRLQLERAEIHLERADKSVADVHEEIMFGDNDNKRSFAHYEKIANTDRGLTKGQAKQLDNFVEHMQTKASKVSSAFAEIQKGPDEVIWVSKTDKNAPVLRQAIEGVDTPTELEYENIDKPDQVTSHYKIHKNSGNWVTQVNNEAEYGVKTQQVISKVAEGKEAIAIQNVETFTEKDIKEIQGLIKNSATTENIDLDALAKTTEVQEATPEVVEAVQTESVEAETVTKETTPVKDSKPEVIKPSEKPDAVQQKTSKQVIETVTEINTDGTVAKPGNTILKQYDSKFPQIHTSQTEGDISNVTNFFEPKNAKQESIATLNEVGGVTRELIVNNSEYLVNKTNAERTSKGQEDIVATKEYANLIANTFESFKKTYEKQGPKVVFKKSSTGEGAYLKEILSLLHIDNEKGETTLPDEVLLAAAVEAVGWLSSDINRLDWKTDDQIKNFLGLDSKDRLTNTERDVVVDMGTPVYQVATDLGARIMNTLNLKAMKDTKYATNKSPLELQDRLETSLGLLALGLLTEVDASTIHSGVAPGKGPFIVLTEVKPKGLERSPDLNEQSINTLKLNDAHSKESIDKILKDLRSESAHQEALTGAQVTKNGVYSNPVLIVQTTVRDSLSKVSKRNQKLIKRLQGVAQAGKKGELRLWNALELDAKKKLAGYENVKPKHTERQESFIASNNALINEIRIVDNYNGEEFYYEYGLQKQDRMMIKSSGINPQNSTIHRHLFANGGITSTVNNDRMRNIFKIAVAAAFGIAIDKQVAQKSVDAFDEIMADPIVKKALEVIKNSNSTDAELQAAILDVNKAYGNKVHLLEGLAALEVYDADKSFDTNITVEIDGITNGYAIGLLQFGGPNLRKDLERVGVFFNDEEYGSWLSKKQNVDVYQELATQMASARTVPAMVEYYVDKYSNQEWPKWHKTIIDRLSTKGTDGKAILKPEIFTALDVVHGKIFEEDKLTSFARSLAKDPLMTTNYGAALAKVLSKMTGEAVEVMYDTMAEIQEEFNNGDKVKAEIDAQRLDNALSTLMGKPAESFTLVNRMQKGTLSSATLTQAETKILEQSIGFIYEPMLGTGLASLLGTIDDEGKSLMSRRTEVTQAYEWVYTGYKQAYDKAIDKLITETGVKAVSPEQKREIAISLLNTFFPKYKGPWADVDTFIDILGKEAVKYDDVTVALDRENVNVKIKQSKDKGDRWVSSRADGSARSTLNTAIRSFDPASPGAKAIVNMVQNMDAALIGSVSEKLDFLTLYDAGMFALKDLDRASEIYNNAFIELNKSHRFLDQALAVLNKLDAELGKEKGSLQAVTKAYRANSHQAKNTNKDNIKYLDLKTQIKSLENIIKDVNEEMKILDGIVKVNQLYWADVDKVTPNNDIHTEEGLHSIKVDVNAQMHKMFEMGSVGSNTMKLFDFFGKRATKYYSSPEMYREQAMHLEQVLQKLIIPSVSVLDNLSIEVYGTNTFAHGSYNNNHVRINVNTKAPESYTEQAGQEVYVHEMIHAVTQVGLDSNREINRDVRTIYDLLRDGPEKITWQDFLHPEVLHDVAAEEKAAKAMYNYIFGKDSVPSKELHEFMAYALSNPNLIRKLKTMAPIRTKDIKAKNLLENFFLIIKRILHGFQKALGTKKVPRNIHDQMFNLAKDITTINMSRRGVIAKFLYNNGIGTKYKQINNLLVDTMDKAADSGLKKVDTTLDKRRTKRNANPSPSRIVKTVKNLENIPALGIKIAANAAARDAIIDMAYKVRGRSAALIRSFFGELTGITPQQFLDEVLKSTSAVDGSRRATLEEMTELLKSSFVSDTEPTHLQLTAITRLILKTDASTLLNHSAYDIADIMRLFKDPKYLADEIGKLRKTLDLTNNTYYDNAVDGLAEIMVNGESVIHDMSLNAYGIANLGKGKAADEAKLDALISLVAISKTIKKSKGLVEAFNKLADAEFAANADVNGVSEFILQHSAFKVKALTSLFSDNGKDHRSLMAKGYISKLHDSDAQLVVEPIRVAKIDPRTGKQQVINGVKQTEDNIVKMKALGYEMIEKLTGIDGIDNLGLAMFHSTTALDTGRTKGIASVTARKPFGTSLLSIIARNPQYEGQVKATLGRFLQEENARAEAQSKQGKGNKTKKALIPVRNYKGKIVDYRIALSHINAERLLDQDMDAINVMANMFSHMVDKQASQKTNAHLVKVLLADEKLHHTKKNTDKWVNILDEEHYAEYYESFPKQMRYDIAEGATINSKNEREFYVQEKLLDVAFGFKQVTAENLLNNPKASRRLGLGEKMWQRFVSSAVINIVVKIPDVTIANIESNFFTSMIHGASPAYLTKTMQRGWVELENYRDSVKELHLLQQKVAARPAMINNPQVVRKIAILTSNINDNPLHMFMDAGLFTSITEDIHVNEHTSKKSLPAMIKKSTGLNVPPTLIAVAKAGYLTSDSTIGKAMMHTLQASDFLARYALYKWKTEEKNMSHDKAWALITRTFIVYDKPLNRDLQYMNDMGLFMFVRYWLRIQPVVANLVREKPANIALYLAAESMLNIDTPDIIDSSFLDGKLTPTDGGITKVLKEVIIPPAWEIATGKSW